MTRRETPIAALKAAKEAMAENIPITDAAKRHGISRRVTTQARLILEYGTVKDAENIQSGKASIEATASRIRNSLSPEVREEYQKRYANGGAYTPARRSQLHEKATLWAKLGPALRGLSEMPRAIDAVALSRELGPRANTVNQYLPTAFKWLEEFNHEWNKASINEDDTVDARGSNATSGSQHPEPTAE